MAGILAAYLSFLTKHPLTGNMAQSAVLFAAGDAVAQQLIEKKGLKNHDYKRTGRIVLWGSGIYAPAVSVWFKFLDGLPIKGHVQSTIVRVALDQFVSAPTVLTAFFYVMTFMEGGTAADARAKWRQEFLPTLKANWCLFIPFQAFNMVVPLQYRLLTVNAVNIPWNAFLSLQNAKGKHTEPPVELSKMA